MKTEGGLYKLFLGKIDIFQMSVTPFVYYQGFNFSFSTKVYNNNSEQSNGSEEILVYIQAFNTEAMLFGNFKKHTI